MTEDDSSNAGEQPSIAELDRQYHSVRQIRDRYPAVREDHLRYLEKWSLVHPVARSRADRYYGFRDLSVIRQVSEGLERGASFRVILRALVSARDGQLTFDFNQRLGETSPVKVVALRPRGDDGAESAHADGVRPPPAQQAQAARYFREGAELDEGTAEEQARACHAYRKAILLDPTLVPALVNLANIHYARDELAEAQALYERALRLDEECFEAYFNLGNIHHDLGRYRDALHHYGVAIAVNRDYADAHFYLAVTLEKIGQSGEAKAHWREYCKLAPEGEWVDLAKEFSE